jgi:cell division protein FtsB
MNRWLRELKEALLPKLPPSLEEHEAEMEQWARRRAELKVGSPILTEEDMAAERARFADYDFMTGKRK